MAGESGALLGVLVNKLLFAGMCAGKYHLPFFNLNAIKKLISLSHVVDHSLRPREEEVKQLGGVPDGQEGGGC